MIESDIEMKREVSKIVNFIKEYVQEDEKVVIPVSGGIDSDVVARLCCKALGNEKIKLFIVVESNMEQRFLENARTLAKDLNVSLTEIPLEGKNIELIKILEKADKDNIFNSNSLLDSTKIKCSLRSTIISCYQDKGYIIAGCTNRTEYELGFFTTFGDNLGNLKPIEHLYKTEVMKLATLLETREEVINQSPSAGFWKGQEDLEDIAYWIVNSGPIIIPKQFNDMEVLQVNEIKKHLTWEKIDLCLKMIRNQEDRKNIVTVVGLSIEIVNGIINIVKKAKKYKNRKILVSLKED